MTLGLQEWALYCRFRPEFLKVMDERYHTIDWLDQQVVSGEFRFWHSDNAASITEMRTYPTGAKDIHCIIAAGELPEITRVLAPAAEQWGREQGCVRALIESRPAWARALKPLGYETHQVIVRKELQDGP